MSEEKKRTISLEAYLKMQNDWVLAYAMEPQKLGISHTKKEILNLCQGTIDALLKHNDVTVEGGE